MSDTAAQSNGAKPAEEEVIDIDLDDPEVKAAAAKIQGNFLMKRRNKNKAAAAAATTESINTEEKK